MDAEVRQTHRIAWIRRAATLMLLFALVSPAVRNEDGLPLSTYPMYSSARSELSSFATATGVDRAGEPTPLSALIISGSRDRLVAQAFLSDAVGRGDGDAVCREIAARVSSDVVEVEIAVELHDTVDRLRGEGSLRSREVLASCEVRA